MEILALQKALSTSRKDKIQDAHDRLMQISIWEEHRDKIVETNKNFENDKNENTEAEFEISLREFYINEAKLIGYKRILKGEDYERVTHEIKQQINSYTKELNFLKGVLTNGKERREEV